MLTYILSLKRFSRPLWVTVTIVAVVWAFAAQPLMFALQLFTLSLVLLVPIALRGTDPTRWTVIICAAFAACYLLTIAYNYIPLVEMPAAPVEMKMRYAGEWHVIAIVRPELAQKIQTLGLANNVYRLSTWIIVALVSWLLMLKIFENDTRAAGCATVFAVAATFEMLQVIDCKLLNDPFGTGEIALAGEWGERVPKSSCGRTRGPWAPFVNPIICSFYFLALIAKKRFWS